MNISFKATMLFAIVAILAVGLFCACASPAAEPTPPPDEPTAPPGITTTPPDEPSTSQTQRVDVVYFHRPQRCVTCLCFEERIIYVVNTYFQDELNSGKLTFQVCNIGDSKNVDIVKKYGAVGSQLFINTVKDGTDNIKDILEIWSWHCTSNKKGFDQKVKNVIEQSLEDIG